MIAGETVSVRIEKPAAGGRMIARAGGHVLLVAGAIPGERVVARVERVSKGVVYADTLAVDEASPDRRETAGDPRCGGAVYSHIAYDRQLTLKRDVIVDALHRIGHLDPPAALSVLASPQHGYRMRARVHVRGRRVGFFREATHDLCDIRRTSQLLPETCDVIDRVAATMASLAIDAVRELELTENVEASDRAIALDAGAPIGARAIDRLAATPGVTGLVTPAGTHGRPHVVDRVEIGGSRIALQRHVLAFFQGNRHLLCRLTEHVVGHVPDAGCLTDLYAGVGLFAVAAAATRTSQVVAVEGDRYAAADLVVNASGRNIRAVRRSVEEFTAGAEPDEQGTVIVDPPRTGLSQEALTGVRRLSARRIIYVSCDVATLARDARRLVDGGYRVAGAHAFDLFPNTPHVETVVVFDRAA